MKRGGEGKRGRERGDLICPLAALNPQPTWQAALQNSWLLGKRKRQRQPQ